MDSPAIRNMSNLDDWMNEAIKTGIDRMILIADFIDVFTDKYALIRRFHS